MLSCLSGDHPARSIAAIQSAEVKKRDDFSNVHVEAANHLKLLGIVKTWFTIVESAVAACLTDVHMGYGCAERGAVVVLMATRAYGWWNCFQYPNPR